MLDVATYRQAMDKLGEETQSREEQWRTLHEAYVGNLNRLHDVMQRSDVVFWEPPQRVGMKKNKDWLSTAVAASIAHRRNLKTILGVTESDICQVNVLALYSLGTAKRNTLQSIAKSLPQLPGLTLLFLPVIPNKLKHEASAAAGASAAVGASSAAPAAPDSHSGSDSDLDSEGHDFNADGVLPEALTSMHTVKTSQQTAMRCPLLSAWLTSMSATPGRCLHKVDESGKQNTTSALLLLPTHDA